MPRIARKKHDEAVYHIMVRGNNREKIFFEDEDRVRYLETLKRYKAKFQISIFAYCLMDNHAHLIIDCCGQDISKVMHGINLSYTQYINRKYRRCGHLFQNRFKSVIVDGDNYIIQATKYIHQNPVKAGICDGAQDYKWSSFNIYTGKRDVFGLINTDFVLGYFSENKSRARELYIEYVDSSLETIVSEIEKDMYENRDRRIAQKKVSINKVLSWVADFFNICVQDITVRCSKRNARARQLAAYLISLRSNITYREVGIKFGITSSAVGQNIKKAVELLVYQRDIAFHFGLTI